MKVRIANCRFDFATDDISLPGPDQELLKCREQADATVPLNLLPHYWLVDSLNACEASGSRVRYWSEVPAV